MLRRTILVKSSLWISLGLMVTSFLFGVFLYSQVKLGIIAPRATTTAAQIIIDPENPNASSYEDSDAKK